ncbi:MAG: DNA-binding protein [Acetobacteraceae bacterium]|nr:DNA-binding protein [Acetobacteraceae bacterium]
MNPALNAVRKKLGGGSFTTISDAMTVWKERQRRSEGCAHQRAGRLGPGGPGARGGGRATRAADTAYRCLARQKRRLRRAAGVTEGTERWRTTTRSPSAGRARRGGSASPIARASRPLPMTRARSWRRRRMRLSPC